MIGKPKILLLDDISSGVDLTSKHVLWRAIREEGRDSAVIMTTHTMDEAQVLSDKLAIMVQGRFKAIGDLKEI